MSGFERRYGEQLRELTESLLRFDTSRGRERAAQDYLEDRLGSLGFEVHEWKTDADIIGGLPEFRTAEELAVDDRPNVAGVVSLGDPEEGKTLVLNGHMDVVPADPEGWSGDPFEPRWNDGALVARGAADMKSQLATCVFAAVAARETARGVDGRIVVESVAGEEEGGFGAATAAVRNPYPFERDAAIVTEPTDCRIVTATEGALMGRIRLRGRPAHAARKWEGESVFPHFERVRDALAAVEANRADGVTHPLYDRFAVPWPIVVGRVRAGNWASNVAGSLTAELRAGVAPGESLDAVERDIETALAAVASDDEWLREHPPIFERFGVQFESAEIDADEAVVRAVRTGMERHGHAETTPIGETYGSDARHYIRAGIPTAVFGPGRIEAAHFPDESIEWDSVLDAGEILRDSILAYLGD
jgi:acetylornithine deacetylase